jgi:hypothetical protein
MIAMKEKEIDEKIAQGHILVRAIFEMAGNPKEHVESTLKGYITAIKEDPEYVFMKEHLAPAEETEPGVWSTFLETDILITNFEKLNVLCVNLVPSSIEIIRPQDFAFEQKKLTDLYNDITSRLHELSVTTKNLSLENDLLKVNLNRCIRNLVTIGLIEPKTIEELAQKIGIDAEHIRPFLDAMIKEKTIVEQDKKYMRV